MCTVQKDYMQGKKKKTKNCGGSGDDDAELGAAVFNAGKVFDRWGLA